MFQQKMIGCKYAEDLYGCRWLSNNSKKTMWSVFIYIYVHTFLYLRIVKHESQFSAKLYN